MNTFRNIIDLWPSRYQMAVDIGATHSQVLKWWQRDNIPAEWWMATVEAASIHGHHVSLGSLAMAADRRRFGRTHEETAA